MLTKIHFENFTAFKELDIDLSPGINVFIGKNGTGKTHILKIAYAACDISVSQRNFADKLEKVFYPSHHQLGRLARREKGNITAKVVIYRTVEKQNLELRLSFTNRTMAYEIAHISGAETWKGQKTQSVFIPSKDMMANAPGFRALYSQREIHFEEIYDDIIAKAFLGSLKGLVDKERQKILDTLQKAIGGKVIAKNEEFFLQNKQGELEFTLLAEGFQKLALLWLLIQNGVLLNGSILFWDEPEANLTPALMELVAEILLALQRQGVQIFIATHDYAFLRLLSLKLKNGDNVLFHSLYHNDAEIQCSTTSSYCAISPYAIDIGYEPLANEEIKQEIEDR